MPFPELLDTGVVNEYKPWLIITCWLLTTLYYIALHLIKRIIHLLSLLGNRIWSSTMGFSKKKRQELQLIDKCFLSFLVRTDLDCWFFYGFWCRLSLKIVLLLYKFWLPILMCNSELLLVVDFGIWLVNALF